MCGIDFHFIFTKLSSIPCVVYSLQLNHVKDKISCEMASSKKSKNPFIVIIKISLNLRF